jgi:methylmalonyl-CoA mutase N-terminal domain/subunit
MWAKIMKERFGAKSPKSLLLRTHAQTSGASLTAQQPFNNVVRVAIQALAGVMGGVQSLHTNSMDETLALPTEQAVMVALRTQQVIAEESGVTNTVDPLGGSWAIEALTDKMEKEAFTYINRIDELGGIIRAIDIGYPQKEIADAAYRYQQQLDSKEKVIVGVNKYALPEERPMDILKIDHDVEERQVEKVRKVKRERDSAKARDLLGRVHAAARNGNNLMPHLIEAVKNHVTLGEISDVYREVFGVYRDPAWL